MAPSRRKRSKSAAAAAAARRQWKVGDLVLAKVKGFQAWPAMVSEPRKWGYAADWKKVLVCFFGTQQIAFCNPADVEAFTEEKKHRLLGKRHGKYSEFGRALIEIVDTFEKLKKQDEVDNSNDTDDEDTVVTENNTAEVLTESISSDKSPLTASQPCQEKTVSSGTQIDANVRSGCDADANNEGLSEREVPLEDAGSDMKVAERSLITTYLTRRRSERAQARKSSVLRRPPARRSRSSSRVDTVELQNVEGPSSHYDKSITDVPSGILEDRSARRSKRKRKMPSLDDIEVDSCDVVSNCSAEGNDSGILTVDSGALSCKECSDIEWDSKCVQPVPVTDLGQPDNKFSKRLEFQTNTIVHKKKRKPKRKRPSNESMEYTYKLDEKIVSDTGVLKSETILRSDPERSPETCSREDGDEHLPLFKRARVRMGRALSIGEEPNFSQGSEEKLQKESQSLSDQVSHSLHGEVDGSTDKEALHDYRDLDKSSPPHKKPENAWLQKVQTTVPCGSSLDVEAALPPSKRLHRALEAMSANAAEDNKTSVAGSPIKMAGSGGNCSDFSGDACKLTERETISVLRLEKEEELCKNKSPDGPFESPSRPGIPIAAAGVSSAEETIQITGDSPRHESANAGDHSLDSPFQEIKGTADLECSKSLPSNILEQVGSVTCGSGSPCVALPSDDGCKTMMTVLVEPCVEVNLERSRVAFDVISGTNIRIPSPYNGMSVLMDLTDDNCRTTKSCDMEVENCKDTEELNGADNVVGIESTEMGSGPSASSTPRVMISQCNGENPSARLNGGDNVVGSESPERGFGPSTSTTTQVMISQCNGENPSARLNGGHNVVGSESTERGSGPSASSTPLVMISQCNGENPSARLNGRDNVVGSESPERGSVPSTSSTTRVMISLCNGENLSARLNGGDNVVGSESPERGFGPSASSTTRVMISQCNGENPSARLNGGDNVVGSESTERGSGPSASSTPLVMISQCNGENPSARLNGRDNVVGSESTERGSVPSTSSTTRVMISLCNGENPSARLNGWDNVVGSESTERGSVPSTSSTTRVMISLCNGENPSARLNGGDNVVRSESTERGSGPSASSTPRVMNSQCNGENPSYSGDSVVYLAHSTSLSDDHSLDKAVSVSQSSSLTDGLDSVSHATPHTLTGNTSASGNVSVQINGSCSPGVHSCLAVVKRSTKWNSKEAHDSLASFEANLGTLTRTKESIGRATRLAIDCAKHRVAAKVVEVIARNLEREPSLHKRVDLFFLVDSIAQCSNGLKSDIAGIYPSAILGVLHRLLSAAAPPGSSSRENRRQCLKVLRVWLDRRIFPESTIRQHIRDLDSLRISSCSRASRRSFRNERAFDDPVREMEGMLVDEYGSNSSFQLPGFCMPPMLRDEDDGVDSDGESFEAVTPEHDTGKPEVEKVPVLAIQKRTHILEDIDGELEMEDVAPSEGVACACNVVCMNGVDTSSLPIGNSVAVAVAPPLPEDVPPASPPLPASPPPPPPPPPLPPLPPPSEWTDHITNSSTALSQVPNQISKPANCSSFGNPHFSHQQFQSENKNAQAECCLDKGFRLPPPHPAPSNQFSYVQNQRVQSRRGTPPPSHSNGFHTPNTGNGNRYRNHERTKFPPRGFHERWRTPQHFPRPNYPDDSGNAYAPAPYTSQYCDPNLPNHRWGFPSRPVNHQGFVRHRPSSGGASSGRPR